MFKKAKAAQIAKKSSEISQAERELLITAAVLTIEDLYPAQFATMLSRLTPDWERLRTLLKKLK